MYWFKLEKQFLLDYYRNKDETTGQKRKISINAFASAKSKKEVWKLIPFERGHFLMDSLIVKYAALLKNPKLCNELFYYSVKFWNHFNLKFENDLVLRKILLLLSGISLIINCDIKFYLRLIFELLLVLEILIHH